MKPDPLFLFCRRIAAAYITLIIVGPMLSCSTRCVPSSFGVAANGDMFVDTREVVYLITPSSDKPSVYLTFPSPFDRIWSPDPALFAVSPSGVIYYSLGDPAVINMLTPHQEGHSASSSILGSVDTRFDYVRDLTIGPGRRIFAVDSRPQILVFASKATELATPEARWRGDATELDSPGSLAVNSKGDVCVGNEDYQVSNSINCYSVGRYGNVPPGRQIGGDRTLIERNLVALTVDRDGQIYALTNSPDRILIFAPRAEGNVSPLRVISGPHTGLSEPFSIAIDSKSRIVVLNYRANSITVYASHARGDAPPMGVIRGTYTQMNQPQHLALMPNDGILVSSSTRKLLLFAADEFGNVRPRVSYVDTCIPFLDRFAVDQDGRVYLPGCTNDLEVVGLSSSGGSVHKKSMMVGSRAVFYQPTSLAFDRRGNLFIADANHLTEFAPEARGDVAPSKVWSLRGIPRVDALAVADNDTAYFANSATDTVLIAALGSSNVVRLRKYIRNAKAGNNPRSLAVDELGTLYVANEGSDSVTIFNPSSTGDEPPTVTLRGFWTRIHNPTGIAIGPNGDINVLSGRLQYTSSPYFPEPLGEILVFKKGSAGNTSPERVTQFTRMCATDSL